VSTQPIIKSKESVLNLSPDRYNTGGVHEVLRIAVDARVSVVKHIDVSDGLVNGAIQSVMRVTFSWWGDCVPQ